MPIYDPATHVLPADHGSPFELYDPPPPQATIGAVQVSLDPDEKIGQKPPPEALERGYAFRKHKSAVEQLDRWLIERCNDEALKNRILSCGSDAWVDQSPSTGRFRVRCKRCLYRACPLCRIRWALATREKIESVLAEVEPRRRKLLTLTLKSSNAPLRDQIEHLWSAHRRLRHRKLWRDAVRGCIAVLEITWNNDRKQWHPHLHCLIDSDYIDQRALSKAWLSVTFTSKIVDIRAVRSFEKASTYLTKYLTKATTLPDDIDPIRLDEYYNCYRKTRFTRFQGSLRPRPGEEIWRPPYPTDWQPLTPLGSLLERAAIGETFAIRVLDKLAAERTFQREPDIPDEFPP